MKSKTKFLVMLIASIVCICALAQTNIFAEEVAEGENATVTIKTVDQLADAIEKQAKGQTWDIQEGTYTLTQEHLNKYKDWGTNGEEDSKVGQGNWYFPIHEDNITIKGTGKVLITSDVETPNGAWASQDFISVWGDGITIDGIEIKCKKEQNKAIEVMGKNAILKNITLQKVNEDGSGSIIFNADDIGNATVENVKLHSWITASYSKGGNLTTKNVTIDFTDNTYAGYHDETNGYAWRPLINAGESVTLKNSNFKLIVDSKTNLTEQVFMDKLPEGTTVTLTENATVDKMLNITKDNVTLDLGGYTLTASDAFESKWENHNDSHLLQVEGAKNVTIKNGSLVTTVKNKHGINLFDADDVVLDNLKVDNTNTIGGAPIVINNSSATVKGDLDLTIGENSWYGINVDPKEGSASLSFADGSSVSMTGGSEDQPVMELDGDKDKINLSGTEEAGLITDENGNYVINEKDEKPSNTKPEENQSSEGNTQAAEQNPSTGDNLILYVTLLGISILGMVSAVIIKRKNA